MRLIKSELFRISKMKSVLVLAIVLFLLSAISMYSVCRFDTGGVVTNDSTTQEGYNAGYAVGNDIAEGKRSAADTFWGDGVLADADIPTFFSVLSGSNVQLLLMIFVSLYAASEYSLGYSKNILMYSGKRLRLLINRMVILLITTICTYIYLFIVTVIQALIFRGSITMNLDVDFFAYVGITLLSTYALLCVACLVADLFRNVAGTMAVNLILELGIVTGIITLIEMVLSHLSIFSNGCEINKYLIVSILNSGVVSLSMTGRNVELVVVSSVIHIVIAAGLSGLLICKRDRT